MAASARVGHSHSCSGIPLAHPTVISPSRFQCCGIWSRRSAASHGSSYVLCTNYMHSNSESIFLIQSLATVTMPSSTCDLRSFYTISLLNAIFNVCDLICGCVWPLQPGPVARGSLTDKNRGLATASDLDGCHVAVLQLG